VIKEKRIKAEGNNRKRLSILQRKNEEEKKKRRRNKFPMHLMTNKEEHLQMKGLPHISANNLCNDQYFLNLDNLISDRSNFSGSSAEI
jgi:hypothetical protein